MLMSPRRLMPSGRDWRRRREEGGGGGGGGGRRRREEGGGRREEVRDYVMVGYHG